MSLLASLVRAYDRLPYEFGYSSEKIGFCVVLNEDGSVSDVIDQRDTDNRRSPKQLLVPQPKKRTSGIDPNFLWDKTSYVLGVTSEQELAARDADTPEEAEDRRAKREKSLARVASQHAKFRDLHLEWLADSADTGLLALRSFLETWRAGLFTPPKWPEEMRDQNVVFRLASEDALVHQRTAAKELWRELASEAASDRQICLVTGEAGSIARLHPSIKGVLDAQQTGASLISFNRKAFTSYGHEQGNNAPVSETAAFAYTTALNDFLSDKDHRIQIGDTSTVFWADAETIDVEKEAEALYFSMAGDERDAASRVKDRLERIRNGRKLKQIAPELAEGVRFYVLGLAPNAARLSVRFFWEGDFGALTSNYQTYLDDTKLEPPPRNGWPPLKKYLDALAAPSEREKKPGAAGLEGDSPRLAAPSEREKKRVSAPMDDRAHLAAPSEREKKLTGDKREKKLAGKWKKLAGEWMRAILSGTPYPLTLMSATLMRIRADGEIDALRAAILKSVLIRNLKMEAPVALDRDNTNKGYVLGRLFAAYEQVQHAALGGKVNATIKDKFYGAASATPQKVFRTLDAGSQNHFAKLRKQNPRRAVNLEKTIGSIMELMDPGSDPIPVFLNSGEQALFGIGYYHQHSYFFTKHDDKTPEVTQ